MQINFIQDNAQEYGKKELDKFYRDNLIPAEKKNFTIDLKKSFGPYLAVDAPSGETCYILDAASQIASFGLGFSASAFLGVGHFQETWEQNSKGDHAKKVLLSFQNLLARCLNKSSREISLAFCQSGAESNEYALGICYRKVQAFNQKAKKVLAFEGGFHGRTMISLASTWNKSKREPFAWPGYETTFLKAPSMEVPEDLPPTKEWGKIWGRPVEEDISLDGDDLLQREYQALLEAREKLLSGEYFAVIIEPMQCEGGDRYLSDRFLSGLLMLAKTFDVPVIFDEVQTGFHLGKKFFWHQGMNLHDGLQNRLEPDFVVCAKKSQIGIVISLREEVPIDNTSHYFHVASMFRGYIQAQSLLQSTSKILSLQAYAKNKLEDWQAKYSKFLKNPRGQGLAFAIDLKDNKYLNEFVQKRFSKGLLFYPAGSSTLRFRLNLSFKEEDLNFLFTQLGHLSEEIFLGRPQQGIATLTKKKNNSLDLYELHGRSIVGESNIFEKWQQIFSSIDKDISLISLGAEHFEEYKDSIHTIQKEVYEETRQSPLSYFKKSLELNPSPSLGVLYKGKLRGLCFAGLLQDFPKERGTRQDPYVKCSKTLYMVDMTLGKELRSKGIGNALKLFFKQWARELGFERLQGRNRDQLASSMANINLSLGAWEQTRLVEDYPDGLPYRDVFYYTLPLTPWKSKLRLNDAERSEVLAEDLTYEFVLDAYPSLTNKVCLSNFVGISYMNIVKDFFHMLPACLRHGFTASGLSECVDKIAKSVWFHSNKTTFRMLSFEGHYFGSGTFLSRSLSGLDDYFPVDRLEAPGEGNQERLIEQIRQGLQDKKYLGIWIEPLPQNSQIPVPSNFLEKLCQLQEEFQVPVIFNETASSGYAYTSTYFASSSFTPSACFSYFGGQWSFCALREKYFLSKPLMMISTWDGDEFSAKQAYYHLQNLKKEDNLEEIIRKFEDKLKEFLSPYPIKDLSLSRGHGQFRGAIPLNIRELFTRRKDGVYLISPSIQAMKKFLTSEDM